MTTPPRRIPPAPFLTLVISPLLAVAPLNDSQLTRLHVAADHSSTVDEAALYALLENAGQWEGEIEAGSVIPDFDPILSDPADWRGRLCLVEGTLWRVIDPDLGRTGWQQVRGLVLELPASSSPLPDTTPPPRRFVIVYLTDPPDLNLRVEEHGLPWRLGAPVRVAARFYKLLNSTTEAGEERSVPVFVGQRVTSLGQAAGTGSGGTAVVVVTLVVVVAAGYAAYRLYCVLRSVGRRNVDASRRELERVRPRPAAPRDPTLPDDPAEALNVLSDRAAHHPTTPHPAAHETGDSSPH